MHHKKSPFVLYSISLFFVLLVSFGLLLPFLGFYWDDWETILVGKLFPISEYWQYFQGMRPLAAWTYILFSPIAGSSPLIWHLIALFFRGLTAWGFWWVFGLVWPTKRTQIGWASLLFVVYPLFRQQAIAVSYHQHWVAFSLYFISVGCMLKFVKAKKGKWLWLLGSLFAEGLHISILEYFIGVEFLRPILIWWMLKPEIISKKNRLKKTLQYWLPNLLLLTAFIIWRLINSNQAVLDPNAPVLLFNLFSDPATSFIQLVKHFLQDSMYILVGSWFNPLSPSIVEDFPKISFVLIILIQLITGFVLYYLLKKEIDSNSDMEQSQDWIKEASITALAAILLGGLQIWVTDRQTYSEGLILFADRFLLPSMMGAALLWIVGIDWFGRNTKTKIILVSILIAVSVGLHLRIANDFRWSWINQKRVYWQLYWRAPWIEPATSYLEDDLPFSYVMPTFSYHLLYNQPRNPEERIGAFIRFNPDFVYNKEEWLAGKLMESEHRNFHFSANTKNSLVMYYHPEQENNCLWILEPSDKDHPLIPEIVKLALPLSNISRIKAENPYGEVPDPVIFGKEPEKNWCYFYEKAALARQNQDWAKIVQLGDQAQEKGFNPSISAANSPYEWIPFIQGYANQGNWEMAEILIKTTYPTNKDYRKMLCRVWSELGPLTAGDIPAQQHYQNGLDDLECNGL
jgi:hypothetical protein